MKTTLLTFIVSLFAFISINAIVPSTHAIQVDIKDNNYNLVYKVLTSKKIQLGTKECKSDWSNNPFIYSHDYLLH